MSLKALVSLGSVRDSTPPRQARLGRRVVRVCIVKLAVPGHNVVSDPLDLDLSGPSKQQFAYRQMFQMSPPK